MIEEEKVLVMPSGPDIEPKNGEILQAKVENDGLQYTMDPTIWEDPSSWGVVLADIAHHIAETFQMEHNIGVNESLAIIREHFNNELDFSTDEYSNEYID